MTITQLEYIVAIDTYRHFAAAAGKCFVTQPTLSMQIQKLEDELNIKLFDRSKQPVVPTDIGSIVIQQARKILHEVEVMHQLINEQKGTVSGALRVGIIPTLAPYLLPLFLQQFLTNFPDVHIKVKEMTTEVILDDLKNGKIDVGLLVTPLEDPNIQEHPLFNEELVAYVSKKNLAYKKQYVLPQDIDIKELWILEEGHCLRSQMINLCALKKEQLQDSHFDYEAGSVETLRKMVEQNAGITILPELATIDFSAKQLQMVRHFKSPVPVREVSLVTHRNYIKKKLVDALKTAITASLPAKIIANKNQKIIQI
ncbi:MAG: hydrogen peroxide-inducible genes activator [Ferruginibacter sp.]